MSDEPAAVEIIEGSDVARSSRDLEELRVKLEVWLSARVGSRADVPELTTTSATGMSSETLLFEGAWEERGEPQFRALVARVAPDPADVPVFPTYAMGTQFDVIRLVGELSPVPVPEVLWYEPDESVIGAPFFVMGRVDGLVPPDVPPYPFGGNWLFDASPEEQRTLQDSTVDTIAALHAIERPTEVFSFTEFPEAGDTHLRRHVAHARAWYDYATHGAHRSSLVERGFDWIEAHWPQDEGDTVLSWGDSRIGNVMYRAFRPAAVLDWEMVGLGPREIDLGWLIYAHRCFHVMATGYGFPGMPDLFPADDVAARYEQASGQRIRDLDFYIRYAAVQWGIVGVITGLRSVHFGQREMPADVNDLLYNRASLEPLLD